MSWQQVNLDVIRYRDNVVCYYCARHLLKASHTDVEKYLPSAYVVRREVILSQVSVRSLGGVYPQTGHGDPLPPTEKDRVSSGYAKPWQVRPRPSTVCLWHKLLYLPFKTKDGNSKNKLVSCIEMISDASSDVTKLL